VGYFDLVRRFDRIELGICGVVCLLLGFAGALYMQRALARPQTEYDDPLPQSYASRFGSKQSMGYEEWLIRDFFNDKRDGVFVDVGAGHYMEFSNTYTLETELGWSGIAIDAQAEYAADYQKYRPRTRFVAAFVSDKPDATVKFFVPPPGGNKLLASSDPEFVASHGEASAAREMPTATLDQVLTVAGVTAIDLLSMDIELHEPQALAGFSIEKYRPALVCIEAHFTVRQQILDYFAAHGYTVVGNYLRLDTQNLYFTPSR
jgi:FkbM family methyltransferase